MAERKINRTIYQKKKRWRWLFFIFNSFLLIVFLSLCLVLGVFIYYAKDLPRPEKFTERELFQSTKIYDRSGKILLYEIFGEEKRTYLSLDKISNYLKKAVIATEDANFYRHKGLDFKAIVRALLIDFKIGKFTYGASTIPQQLIRSTYLSVKKTPERKIKEVILTLELERRYSKDQIFEWYLNQIPFGRNAYGVEAAAQVYFEKSAFDLSLGEAATLTALIKAPSYYSDENNFEKLLERRNFVLERMFKENFINKEELENSKKEPLNIVKEKYQIKAPHFVMYVKDYLIEKYGENFLKEKGLKVYTSLDWELQELAEKIVKEGAEKNKAYNAHNAALVAINPKNGEILAMVGSKDWYATSSYPANCTPGKNCLFEPYPNVALRGRQPGSAFKPFVYLTAFEKGYDDKTVVVDEPTCWPSGNKEWCPQNYDGLFRGPVTLRQALAQSLNIPSVKVLDSLAGLNDSIKNAQKFGITTLTDPKKYGLAIVLGGAEVKLLDMVSAYGVFATEGMAISPVSILKIEDTKGNVIEENKTTPKRVIDAEPVRILNSILSDNEARAPIFGSRSWLYFENYQIAAKTGTTENWRDAWTIGYTPSIVVGVWVGNNDNTPMNGVIAIVVAGKLWHDFMEKILPKLPKENFTNY